MDTLLIEDDEVDAEAFKRALRRAGMPPPMHVATDGREALEFLRSKLAVDGLPERLVVLLDLNMVGMSGTQFLDEPRADPDLRHTVVFVLTTSKSDRDRERAYGRCVAGYVSKGDAGRGYERLIQLLSAYGETVAFPRLGVTG